MRRITNGQQVKIGSIISYVLIIANALYGLIITPFVMESVGSSSYGVYKTIASLSSAMMVLDFGLGGTMMRYIAKYRAKQEDEKIEPFISMGMIEAIIVIGVLIIASVGMYFGIDVMYADSFTNGERILAKNIFSIQAVCMCLHILENVLNGIITGYNNFIMGNGLKAIRLAVRILLVYILISITHNILAMVIIDLCVTLAMAVFEWLYIQKHYGIKICISLKNWNQEIFKESFIYSSLLLLTSIAVQVNNNLDNVVIGAIRGSELVTIYSFGLVIFGMFEQLSTSISGVMLPTVTNVLNDDESGEKIQNVIVKMGRIQFALLGAAVVGFTVLGKSFLNLWLGDGFEDVYIIVLILMIPSTFELCVNVCLSVLRAKNMLGFRTGVLFASTLMNLVITIIGVKYWSYIAAAVGTAMSFIVGSLIVMNIYYTKKLNFNMVKIYARILDRIWLCLIIAGGAIWFSSKWIIGGWLAFIANVLVFCLVYGICLLLFGFSKEERKSIPILRKIF